MPSFEKASGRVCITTPRAQLLLPATLAAPEIGREFLAASTCSAHRLAELDDAILLASEAITNAVIHGLPPVWLAIDCLVTTIEVRVRDRTPKLPMRRESGELDEGGRGMFLVDVLSETWGIDLVAEGKEVWFRLALPLNRVN